MEDSAFTVQCCVDGPELRSLSKMLACCDRVGKEVYLQATETGIVLRSLNLSQSAFVVFNLKLDFFPKGLVGHTLLDQGSVWGVTLHGMGFLLGG